MAHHTTGHKNGTRQVKSSMRCVLYMVLALSLRRRNLARRALRTGTSNPNTPRSSRLRYGHTEVRAVRSRMRSRLSSLIQILPFRRAWSITYM